ncbi:unnamed protein product, partial [marine sediment metagenome]
AHYEAIFEEYFLKGINDLTNSSIFDKSLFLLEPSEFDKVISKLGFQKNEKRYFIKYLESRHGIRYKAVRLEGKVIKKYAGVKLSTRGETMARGWTHYQNL